MTTENDLENFLGRIRLLHIKPLEPQERLDLEMIKGRGKGNKRDYDRLMELFNKYGV